MSGLETLLDQVDRQTDATVGRLGMSAPAVTDGTAEGRFTLPGLIALRRRARRIGRATRSTRR